MSETNVKSGEKAKKTVPKAAETDKTKDIRAQFEHLRSVIKDICQSLTANMERDILELIGLVNSGSPVKKGAVKIKPAKLKKAEVLLSKLSVKPQKGRRSDLKKIEKTLEEIKEVLGKGQNG